MGVRIREGVRVRMRKPHHAAYFPFSCGWPKKSLTAMEIDVCKACAAKAALHHHHAHCGRHGQEESAAAACTHAGALGKAACGLTSGLGPMV